MLLQDSIVLATCALAPPWNLHNTAKRIVCKVMYKNNKDELVTPDAQKQLVQLNYQWHVQTCLHMVVTVSFCISLFFTPEHKFCHYGPSETSTAITSASVELTPTKLKTWKHYASAHKLRKFCTNMQGIIPTVQLYRVAHKDAPPIEMIVAQELQHDFQCHLAILF